MKKIIALILTGAMIFAFAACADKNETETKIEKYYTMEGVFENGNIFTTDGNVWYINKDIDNGKKITVIFSDNGTPIEITDDIIIDIIE